MQETGERSIIVLGILQNYYAGSRYKNKRIPTPYPSWHPIMVNRKNATYSRIIHQCEKRGIKLWLTECTDVIAGERNDKFIYKPNVVYDSIISDDWNAILVFGVHAKNVLQIVLNEHPELDKHSFYYLPHPVSYDWRKQLFINTLDVISSIS